MLRAHRELAALGVEVPFSQVSSCPLTPYAMHSTDLAMVPAPEQGAQQGIAETDASNRRPASLYPCSAALSCFYADPHFCAADAGMRWRKEYAPERSADVVSASMRGARCPVLILRIVQPGGSKETAAPSNCTAFPREGVLSAPCLRAVP